MKHLHTFLLLLLIIINQSVAQDFSQISLTDMIYDDGIHSVELYRSGYPFGFPIITLNGSEKLVLAFDNLSDDSPYYKYTFIHCTHDWQPDGMNQIEYLDGFMEDELTEYGYSFNTITPYTHYSLSFPSDMMRITKSGNYILFVYDDTQDNPVLTRRFVVQEPVVADIAATVKQASDVTYMYQRQEVDFIAYTGAYSIRNPAQYLHATILQNGRWDKAIMGLRYRSGKPGEYNFDYDDNSNAFDGGSEFRTFDTKSLKYNGTRIVSVGYQNKENQAYVLEDLARPFGPYVSGNTANGKCYYKTEDFEGDNREEYVKTYFTLRTEYSMEGGKAYVFGELTDWRIIPEAQLHYNQQIDSWETSLFLKQGFYNYQYVWVPNKKKDVIDETYIEGNHWETNNEYIIFLYLQEEGTSYDRLIGFKTLKMSD